MAEKFDDFEIAVGASPLERLVVRWRRYLSTENRYSEHTLAAYSRDLRFFLTFLQGHFSEPPSLETLENLQINDFRAFLAKRRNDGLSSRSLARCLSTLRSFYRYLDRLEGIRNEALPNLRSPKVPHSVPRPISEKNAMEVIAF